MSTIDLQRLGEQFAIPDRLTFAAGPGGLPVAQIRNGHASATVGLQGAHVIAYQPRGQAPVLWSSGRSVYALGKAIRGGIPVCWPWFSSHPSDPSKPSHGFVRTAMWQVRGSADAEAGTALRLGLRDSEHTRALWPHPFDLEIDIVVGARLRVELVARNTGDAPFVCGGALHSYFGVSDVAAVAIGGLDGCAYIDQLDGMRRKLQHGPVTISAETDRIYVGTDATCVIEDRGLGRSIHVAKAGSRSTVVWNPWVEKSLRLGDMAPDDYLGMVCVETTNAADDLATVAPGGEHRLVAAIHVD